VQREVHINGRTRQVSVHRAREGFDVTVDGRAWHVSAAHVGARLMSLLVGEGVRLRPDVTKEPGSGSAPDGATDVREGLASASERAVFSYEVALAPGRARAELAVAAAGSGAGVVRGFATVPVLLDGWRRRREGDGAHDGSGPQRVVAPMPGKVVRVLVRPGDVVRARQPLVVVEAMKMENELLARSDGIVADVQAREGMSVDAGACLVVIEDRPAPEGNER
jgi:biotin carboxyl carrier protein